MKINKILTGLAGMLLMFGATSCEDEKDLIVIDGNLPIKTDVLYMLGSATPNGWDNGNPTPLTPTADDKLVFEWEGTLYQDGEIKLMLVPGSWDVPFIRPLAGGRQINSTDITDETFDMHAGDPDNKWVVTEGGKYRLSFNLRNWTYSTRFLGGVDAPEVEPVESETLYIVGDATPNSWDLGNATPLTKTGAYTFQYEGLLTKGEFKAYLGTDSWEVPHVMPPSAGVKINHEGVEKEDFLFAAAPDNKWNVEEAGMYKLTFDLENWKITAEWLGDAPEVDPYDQLKEVSAIYLIGSATPAGWIWELAPVMEKKSQYTFSWTGMLATGEFKASPKKVFDSENRYLRPSSADVEINSTGVAAPDFIYTNENEGPDDKWNVTEAGTYTITFDVNARTITVTSGEAPAPSHEPIEANDLYLVGDATPDNWNIQNPTKLTRTGDYTFVYEGPLSCKGESAFKACIETGDWAVPFIRPAFENCEISKNGVQSSDFIFQAGDPDYKWKVVDEGTYRLEFDLRNWKIKATFLEAAPDPLLNAKEVYIIGDATPGGWGWDTASVAKKVGAHTYSWTGELTSGHTFKASVEKDPNYSCPFIRPAKANVEVSSAGVAEPGFVFTTGPDDQWKVTETGNYTLTFDLENGTISAKFNN